MCAQVKFACPAHDGGGHTHRNGADESCALGARTLVDDIAEWYRHHGVLTQGFPR